MEKVVDNPHLQEGPQMRSFQLSPGLTNMCHQQADGAHHLLSGEGTPGLPWHFILVPAWIQGHAQLRDTVSGHYA